jgi:hypothetical protein
MLLAITVVSCSGICNLQIRGVHEAGTAQEGTNRGMLLSHTRVLMSQVCVRASGEGETITVLQVVDSIGHVDPFDAVSRPRVSTAPP